jgi:hypothetical protein
MTLLLLATVILIIWFALVVLFPIPWALIVEKENSYWVNKGVITTATADKIVRFEKGKGFKIVLGFALIGSAVSIWISS